MAPEIYQRKLQTEKVDVWALGILLYEMIHMKTPFKNKNLDDCFQILNEKKIFFKSGIHPEIESLVYSCLKFNP